MLYGYLFGLFNLLEGIYILLFVCVQHDKVSSQIETFYSLYKTNVAALLFQVQQEFEKWRRRKSLLSHQHHHQYAGQSPDDNGSPGGVESVRRRPLLDSLCCCLNVLFHPQQQEKHVPMMLDSNRLQAEIRAREDMLAYGMGGGVGVGSGGILVGTMGRTGTRPFNGGMPMADPRLCTPSHGRAQYYMSTLERSNAGATQYYHEDGCGEEDEDERQQQHQSVHMMNYMNDLDAAMTRPIAYPQAYDGEEELNAAAVAGTGQHGYYPQPQHLMAMMAMNGGSSSSHNGEEVLELDQQDPYNHMQNYEHVMHRKESHDRRVEDELWQGATMQEQQQQFFVSQSQLAVGQEFRRGGGETNTHGTRTRRKKGVNGVGGHYQMGGLMGSGMGSAASSSYNVHGGGGGELAMTNGGSMLDFPMEVATAVSVGGRHGRGGGCHGEEPIYEEIMSNGGGSVVGGRQQQQQHLHQHQLQNPGSRHLSAFLNEKGNSVISCLEPIK